MIALADELPERPTPPPAPDVLKDRLLALARTVDQSIAYLDSHEGTYGGLWKIGLVSAVAGLLCVIPGVSFLPATLLPGAVFGVQTVKLTIAHARK